MIWSFNNNEDLKMEYRILNDNEDFGMRLWEKIDEFDGHEGWQSPDMMFIGWLMRKWNDNVDSYAE